MQQVVTYEAVARACERLKSEGQKVTGRAVLAITGGSLGTVLSCIKEWRQGAAQDPVAVPSEIPPRIQVSILRTLEQSQADASAELKEEINQARVREAEALAGLGKAKKRIEQLVAELDEIWTQAVEELQVAEKALALAEQRNTNQIDILTGTKAALGELRTESKATVAEQKKEIKECGHIGNIIWGSDMEKILGTDRRGVYRRIYNRTLLKPLKICGKICWRREDWEKWLEKEAVRQGVAVATTESEPPRRRRGRPTKAEQAAR